jgi:hypothetical protein
MLRQFTQSFNAGLTLIECNFLAGASGAVTNLAGTGVASITKLATGTYQINFTNAYQRHLGTEVNAYSPGTGSTAATALSAGTVYTIATLGTTTAAGWQAAGLSASVTPAVGVSFLATGAGTGTGTCTTPSVSGLVDSEIVGNPNTTLGNSSTPYIIVQLLAPTSSSVTTPVPTNPATGTTMTFQFWMRSSSLAGAGGV